MRPLGRDRRSDPGVAEVHELPDRVLGDVLIDDLATHVVLHPDLAGEAHVGAVETEELAAARLTPWSPSIMRLRERSRCRVNATT